MTASLEMENGSVKLTIRGSRGTAAVLLIGSADGLQIIVQPGGKVANAASVPGLAPIDEAFRLLVGYVNELDSFYTPCLFIEEQIAALGEELRNAQSGLSELPPGTTVQSIQRQIESLGNKLSQMSCSSPAPPPAVACGTDLAMQYQEMYEWCWVAVATSISLFYDSTSTWTQCSLITAVLVNNSGLKVECCPQGDPVADPYATSALYALEPPASGITPLCDHSGGEGDALAQSGNLNAVVVGGQLPLGPLPPEIRSVAGEICAGHPIAVGIVWNGGGAGHVVAIARVNNNLLHILDPIFGEQDILYGDFPTLYEGGATWNAAFLTQPA